MSDLPPSYESATADLPSYNQNFADLISEFTQLCDIPDINKARFLSKHSDVMPSYNNNEILINAIHKGNYCVVNFLMTFPDVQAGVLDDNFSIEIVKLYRTNLRNLGLINNINNKQITRNNKLEILKDLVGLSNLSALEVTDLKDAFYKASQRDRLSTMEWLITVPGALEVIDLKGAFHKASQHNWLSTMEWLITVPGALEVIDLKGAFCKASQYNRSSTMEWLITVPGALEVIDLKDAFHEASQYNRSSTMKWLITVPGALEVIDLKGAFCKASQCNILQTMKWLITIPGALEVIDLKGAFHEALQYNRSSTMEWLSTILGAPPPYKKNYKSN